MTLPRLGCGDDVEPSMQEMDERPRCDLGRCFAHDCDCAPCDGCAVAMNPAGLLPEGPRWLCAGCAAGVIKERRALRHTTDLSRTTEEPAFSMAQLVFGEAR